VTWPRWCQACFSSTSASTMARRDRSRSPDHANKRVRPSHRSTRSPSPTRRSQRPADRRHDDRDKDRDRARDRERERDRDRDRDRDRERDNGRHRDDRHRDERRRDDRRRSRSRDRKDHRERDRPRSPSRDHTPAVVKPQTKEEISTAPAPATATATTSASASPAPEDEKLKARRAKLAAWKQQKDGKKALDDAKARSALLAAGKVPPAGVYIHPVRVLG
jgi:ATP-dependent RNA helicase DDX46/PRP5